MARKYFKELSHLNLLFQTTQLDFALGEAIVLSEEIWEGIIDTISSVEVVPDKLSIPMESPTVSVKHKHSQQAQTGVVKHYDLDPKVWHRVVRVLRFLHSPFFPFVDIVHRIYAVGSCQ